VLERAPHDARIAQRLLDQRQRRRRRKRIGVQEEEHVTARDGGSGIQQLGTRRPARPQEPGPAATTRSVAFDRRRR